MAARHLAAAAGAAAGDRRAARPRRLRGAVAGLAAGALIADEFPPGKRRLRRLLPQRETSNVVGELGRMTPSARSWSSRTTTRPIGPVFHPAIPELADRAGLFEQIDTSPPLMVPVVGGPLIAGVGSLLGSAR